MITLAMIVKSEAAVIGRCLESALPHVSRVHVNDTGSTDGTLEILSELFARDSSHGVHLARREWVSFGHNRTELIENVREDWGHDGHILLLDADMTIEVEPGALDGLDPEQDYLLRYAGDPQYEQVLLVSAKYAHRYVGRTHEFIERVPDEDGSIKAPILLPGVVVHHHLDGANRSGKFERDIELLKQDWMEGGEGRPNPSRTAFYLGNSYRDLAKTTRSALDLLDAVDWYERRIELDGWTEEVYLSHVYAGRILAESAFRWPCALEHFLAAFHVNMQRAEAVYEIVHGFRKREEYWVADAMLKLADVRGWVPSRGPEGLFLERWIEDWGLDFERSITAFYTHDHHESLELCERLLARTDLPASYRAATERNLALAVAAIEERRRR